MVHYTDTKQLELISGLILHVIIY